MNTIGFASYEIYPTIKGGVGSLLTDFLRGLNDPALRVVLLLDIAPAQNRQFRDVDLPADTISVEVIPLCVEELVGNLLESRSLFASEYEFRSFRFAQALKAVHRTYDISYFEFFDYCGVGFFSLSERLLHPQAYPKTIGIHHHNTIEIIDHHTYGRLQDERWEAYVLERAAMPMADCHIVHGLRFFHDEYQGRYLLDPGRAIVCAPRCQPIPAASVSARRKNRVLFYGRQSRLKGLDTFLAGAMLFLVANPEADVLFTIIGPLDSVTDTGISVDDVVPSHDRKRFEMVGPIERNDVAAFASEAMCAVFANRTESFCFALHELFQLGVPVIANDIPAFRDHLSEDDVVFFDGSVGGLSSALASLVAGGDPGLRARASAELHRYQGGDWAHVTAQFPVPPPLRQIEKVLILSLPGDRMDGQMHKPWILASPQGGEASILDIALQRSGSGRGLFLFGVNWSIPQWIVESDAIVQPFDLVIFARDRTLLDRSAICQIADIARRNNRDNAALVVTEAGNKMAFASEAIEALMPRRSGKPMAEVELYALWNWAALTIRDLEGVLHHAQWAGLIAAVAGKRMPWITHVPAGILKIRAKSMPVQETRSVQALARVTAEISISRDNLDGPLEAIAEAVVITKRDSQVFYVFNAGPLRSTPNEIWIAGELIDSHHLKFENEIYQIYGNTQSTNIHIDGITIPVVHLMSGYLKGRSSGSALCVFLRHPYSGSMTIVAGGKIILESLLSSEACLGRPVVNAASAMPLEWRFFTFPFQKLSNLGRRSVEPRNYVDIFNIDQNRHVHRQNLSFTDLDELVRDPVMCENVSELFVGPAELVSIIKTAPLACELLSSRIVLKHCDFWSSDISELSAIAKLAGSLFSYSIIGRISTNSPSLKTYFEALGVEIGLRQERRRDPGNYRPGNTILVLAFPDVITSVSHVMAGLAIYAANHEPLHVVLSAGSPGRIGLDPALFPNLSVEMIETQDCTPGCLPGIGAIICLYPYGIVSRMLGDWARTGIPLITSRAIAEAIPDANLREIVLWDDSFALAENLRDLLGLRS